MLLAKVIELHIIVIDPSLVGSYCINQHLKHIHAFYLFFVYDLYVENCILMYIVVFFLLNKY